MTEEKNLKEEIKGLNEKIDKLVEVEGAKGFKLPWSAKLGKKKIRNGWVIVCYINENKEVQFFKKKVEEGTIIHKEIPYLANSQYMLSYKRKPLLIVPSWSIEPFSANVNMSEAERLKTLSIGYRYIYNRLRNTMLSEKKGFGGILLIVGGILVIGALAYLIFHGGGINGLTSWLGGK